MSARILQAKNSSEGVMQGEKMQSEKGRKSGESEGKKGVREGVSVYTPSGGKILHFVSKKKHTTNPPRNLSSWKNPPFLGKIQSPQKMRGDLPKNQKKSFPVKFLCRKNTTPGNWKLLRFRPGVRRQREEQKVKAAGKGKKKPTPQRIRLETPATKKETDTALTRETPRHPPRSRMLPKKTSLANGGNTISDVGKKKKYHLRKSLKQGGVPLKEGKQNRRM